MTISDYIVKNIKHRLLVEKFFSTKLTISNLAKEYEVSEMPVRSALQTLISQKWLKKKPNGRIEINEKKLSTERVNGKERFGKDPINWYEKVRKDVVKRCLKGDSGYLRIKELTDRYDLGRTQAQGILQRLASEGVLLHTERKGWQIRPVSISEMDDYLSVRVSLEILALNSAKDKLDKKILKQMYDQNNPDKVTGITSMDNSLHRYWISLSGNRYVEDFFDRHGLFYETLYHDSIIQPKTAKKLAYQHRKILRYLLKQEWEKAVQALEIDILSLKPILILGMKAMSS